MIKGNARSTHHLRMKISKVAFFGTFAAASPWTPSGFSTQLALWVSSHSSPEKLPRILFVQIRGYGSSKPVSLTLISSLSAKTRAFSKTEGDQSRHTSEIFSSISLLAMHPTKISTMHAISLIILSFKQLKIFRKRQSKVHLYLWFVRKAA